ncbi:MAG: hypothetical protein P8Z38_13065 [Robiginitalea sp.]
MLRKDPPTDSVFVKAYEDMSFRFLLSISNASYESLKENGLDIIKNEQLRYRLFNFYESIIPRAIQFIQGNDERIQREIADLEKDLFRLEIVQPENGTPYLLKIPASPKYIHHQALHKILDLHEEDTNHKRYRLENLKKHYFKLMETMEKEMALRSIPFTRFDSTAVKRDF